MHALVPSCSVCRCHAFAGVLLPAPALALPPCRVSRVLQRVQMIGGCPVARGTFGRYSDLFLVDTGAGGVDLIFNKRGVRPPRLTSAYTSRGAA